MRNNITSIILALCAFFVIASICSDQFYKTGNIMFQVIIGAGLLCLVLYSIKKIKEITDGSAGY
jgi:hypothetical protein